MPDEGRREARRLVSVHVNRAMVLWVRKDCSMGKYIERPQRRKLTSVTAIWLDVSAGLSSGGEC